ncbi:L,D-transpeptidase family protein [Nitrobacter winogradskyi]|uniref:Murein L,D-transpeptidase YcbB/YkuD n=2 Tax=Nitrobacter winogradskyi TaxID=913 RepID=A0ACC6AII5_NITWI|nr:L,D-transpeptidase family protein [Nitrobacter winogradskyi]MCP1999032.1 murein L,D-transpeptidase YcbB/YkuD [Nitrobacter winogradskyi]GEC16451.1 peptidoglycan-binding protein [Nitrobacter winogradskyi]
MRDDPTNRTGFDRILTVLAATFLAVSTSAAFAQADTVKKSASELAIDAAIPAPEPANVPPPTAADFKAESQQPAASVVGESKPDERKADNSAVESSVSDSSAADAKPADTTAVDTTPAGAAASNSNTPSNATTTPNETASSDVEPSGIKPEPGSNSGTAETKPAEPKTTDAKSDTSDTDATSKDVTAASPDGIRTGQEAGKATEATKDATATIRPDVTPRPEAGAAANSEQPGEPVKTAINVPPADQPTAEKLHGLLDANATKFFSRKVERAAVEKFYTARSYAPLWTEGGTLNTQAQGVIARLRDAAADGLNPSDYPVPDFAAASSPEQLAEADLKLTASMMDYARQAQSGRMHWSQVSADAQYPEHPVDPEQVLTNVTTAKDASAALDSYNPPHKLYRELKQKLAELRKDSEGPVIEIAEGPGLVFRKNAVIEDPRVPQIRARLGVTQNPDDTRFDADVAAAVREFQARHHLKADGVLGNNTIRALNGPKKDHTIDTIIANMERWRWLPRELGAPSLGDAYAILNIPDYSLKVMQHGAPIWSTRVVVGKPGLHATPLLTETMKYITVNPTWNVPPSIIYKEYLPALQQDPTVLSRMGLKLERDRNGGIHISQPPGERNALGRIRFNFPNKFLVYQHDTPDKHLFAKEKRAFSHGCMRVQNPDQYAATLLNIVLPQEHYTPEKVRSMYGRNEFNINFPTPVPVHITYQTAFMDEAGKLHLRADVYDRDAKMLTLLRNSNGRDLETVVAHAQPNYSRPRGNIPQQGMAFNENRGFGGGFDNGGPSFFERLFGVQNPPPQYDDRRRPIYRR